MEDRFFEYVRQRMLPVWTSFPGLRDLRVSTASSPEKGVEYPLHTSFTFEDEAALEAALASPERQESLMRTKDLMTMFEGRIFHVLTRPIAHDGRILGPRGVGGDA